MKLSMKLQNEIELIRNYKNIQFNSDIHSINENNKNSLIKNSISSSNNNNNINNNSTSTPTVLEIEIQNLRSQMGILTDFCSCADGKMPSVGIIGSGRGMKKENNNEEIQTNNNQDNENENSEKPKIVHQFIHSSNIKS